MSMYSRQWKTGMSVNHPRMVPADVDAVWNIVEKIIIAKKIGGRAYAVIDVGEIAQCRAEHLANRLMSKANAKYGTLVGVFADYLFQETRL